MQLQSEETLSKELLRLLKAFSRVLTHNAAIWWFDMWGGWYDDEEFMEFFGSSVELSRRALNMKTGSVSEIAVLIDEKAFAKVNDTADCGFVYSFRKTLGLIGAPYDVFLASDIELIADKYKFFVIIKI